MPRSTQQIHTDALAIWQSGVEAVRSDRLVRDHVRVDQGTLTIGDETLDLRAIGEIAVVGAGKAGAGMADGVEAALGERVLAEKRVYGWLNVPADCLDVNPKRMRGTDAANDRIHLHAARPAGVNEPTKAGVHGAERILDIVAGLRPHDLCLCLISGGGSALLPAPVSGVPLAEKQAVTRLLSSGGANIEELNTVRKHLSRIKGGGLARACRAGRLFTLIISDVLGDPLDVIASGPTVPDTSSPADALSILERYASGDERVAPSAFAHLRRVAGEKAEPVAPACQVSNLVIGNNATAVAAAGREAERRGYVTQTHAATRLEGAAEDIGRRLAQSMLQTQSSRDPTCLITGGEPTVRLAPAEMRGKGGRNQQLALAALVELTNSEFRIQHSEFPFALLSGGTDGEDGPTDAAGAVIDDAILRRVRELNLDPADYLRRNNAYHFFEPLGSLIKTGPTHTNVCDVRVLLVDPS